MGWYEIIPEGALFIFTWWTTKVVVAYLTFPLFASLKINFSMIFFMKISRKQSTLKWFQTIVLYNLKRKFLYKSRHKIACWLFLLAQMLDLQLVSSFVWTKSYFDIHYYSHSYKKENRLLVFFFALLYPSFFCHCLMSMSGWQTLEWLTRNLFCVY